MPEHSPPRLNHVAITMSAEELDDAGRAAILDFYGEVFGWSEGDNAGEQGNPLILYTGAFGEFVYLLPGEPAMQAPALDHFGYQVADVAQLDEILTRARSCSQRHDGVRIIDKSARTTHGPTSSYTLTSCYIGYRLPLLVEIQHLERHERDGA